MVGFNEGIEPSIPLVVYTQKQETYQEFTRDANIPLSEEIIVTADTKYALQCGGFTDAWWEQKHKPANQQTQMN
jgi:hypothetical protein